jgi:hypothetical protein
MTPSTPTFLSHDEEQAAWACRCASTCCISAVAIASPFNPKPRPRLSAHDEVDIGRLVRRQDELRELG